MKSPAINQEANAWTHYWSKAPAISRGCLPDLPGPAADHIQKLWRRFFATLPPGAKLLDLGTGGGAVLTLAKSCRPDLRLFGVDYATALPELDDSITLYPGISFEKLPFADGSLKAVTSQFAIEYGNVLAAAKEVERVLSFAGSYLFICHHAEGVIVRDNFARLKILREALLPAGLLHAAMQAVRRRKKSAPETRQKLAGIFTSTQLKYPDQSLVREIAEDIARIISEPDSLGKLLSMRRSLEMEGQRIMALKKAGLTENRANMLVEALCPKQYPAHLEIVHVPGVKEPFAWLISNSPKMLPPDILGS